MDLLMATLTSSDKRLPGKKIMSGYCNKKKQRKSLKRKSKRKLMESIPVKLLLCLKT